MPIYEFRCNSCHQESSLLVRSISQGEFLTCPACGSQDITRFVPRVAMHRSSGSYHEDGEPSHRDSSEYYRDPRNIGRWVEKKMRDMGEEVPSQISEMIEKARSGEMPERLKEKGIE